MRRVIGLVVIILLVFLGLSFGQLNPQRVKVDYFFGASEVSVAIALLVAVGVGAVLGVIAAMAVVVRQNRENARLRKRVSDTEKELNELRRLPLKDSP